jgi:hypothetical protein
MGDRSRSPTQPGLYFAIDPWIPTLIGPDIHTLKICQTLRYCDGDCSLPL